MVGSKSRIQKKILKYNLTAHEESYQLWRAASSYCNKVRLLHHLWIYARIGPGSIPKLQALQSIRFPAKETSSAVFFWGPHTHFETNITPARKLSQHETNLSSKASLSVSPSICIYCLCKYYIYIIYNIYYIYIILYKHDWYTPSHHVQPFQPHRSLRHMSCRTLSWTCAPSNSNLAGWEKYFTGWCSTPN